MPVGILPNADTEPPPSALHAGRSGYAFTHAPPPGIFEPAVEIGDTVGAGQVAGFL